MSSSSKVYRWNWDFYQKLPHLLWNDKLSANFLVANSTMHSRMNRTQIDCHFLREKVVKGEFFARHISTIDQITYIFTKGLGSQGFFTVKEGQFCLRVCVIHNDPKSNENILEDIEQKDNT